MQNVWLWSAILIVLSTSAFGRDDLQQMLAAERTFQQAANQGLRSAYLKFLAADAVIFRPNAVNGPAFWKDASDSPAMTLQRKTVFADIAANGLLGYTTGNWVLYPKGKSEADAKFGEYVTVWEKKADGNFRISLQLETSHDKLTFMETDAVFPFVRLKDSNQRGWSPADASLQFLRMAMGTGSLGRAYGKFGASDVRLLVESEPPILGRKRVVAATKKYISVLFPQKVALFQSADMAYNWNACEFANSVEGMEKGNCLLVWKLRKKKWRIVLGAYARASEDNKPELVVRKRPSSRQ